MKWLLSALLVCFAAVGFADPMDILSFDTRIDWHSDSSFEVKEQIKVKFNEAKHGIYRFIPISLSNGKGSTRQIFLSPVKVTVDGKPDETSVTYEGPNERIRIGRESVVYPAGTLKTYEISYKVENAVNWFGEKGDWQPWAEMYWNATGNGWEAPIQRVGVQVKFPFVTRKTDVRAQAFVGYYGSTEGLSLQWAGHETDDQIKQLGMSLTQDTLTINLRRPLDVGEGLTFSLGVPEGLIAQPPTATQLRWFFYPNLGFFLPVVALVGGIIGFLKMGRDPKGGPMVVQFDPPDNLTGSEIGTFLDERVDQRDLAAGIITLAVNGYLTIQASKTGLVFTRDTATLLLTGKQAGPELGPFEIQLLSLLQKCPTAITESSLSEVVAPEVMSLRSILYKSLVTRGYYRRSPETDRAILGVALVLVTLLAGFITVKLSVTNEILPTIIGFVVSIPIIAFFTKTAARRTDDGAKAWQRARGFEEFIRRAKGYEVEWMSKTNPDAALFEKYLPHAVAFGLAEQWANMFSGIVTQAPNWYVSPYGGPFRAGLFAHDLNSLSNSVASSAFTPPRSSGASGGNSGFSSGGGFSGGGFGGGGGGSW